MVRSCHLDTCPVGIATQRPELRAKFAATPEQVEAYLLYVAGEARELLAALGLRSIDEAVGRADLLRRRSGGGSRVGRPRRRAAARHARGALRGRAAAGRRRRRARRAPGRGRRAGACGGGAGRAGVRDRQSRPHRRRPSGRTDRPRVRVARAAGPDQGAFRGLRRPELRRISRRRGRARIWSARRTTTSARRWRGGRIAIRPPENDAGDPVLVGNTALYGATGGELYCAGRAGERFAVRNSGAVAVVEGLGDHGCEYMTGGTVVVLGETGRNFGAGMSGGEAYVYDPAGELPRRLNDDLVALARVAADAELRRLVAAAASLHGIGAGGRAARRLGDGGRRVLARPSQGGRRPDRGRARGYRDRPRSRSRRGGDRELGPVRTARPRRGCRRSPPAVRAIRFQEYRAACSRARAPAACRRCSSPRSERSASASASGSPGGTSVPTPPATTVAVAVDVGGDNRRGAGERAGEDHAEALGSERGCDQRLRLEQLGGQLLAPGRSRARRCPRPEARCRLISSRTASGSAPITRRRAPVCSCTRGQAASRTGRPLRGSCLPT